MLIAEGQLLLEGPPGTAADEETSVPLAGATGGRRLLGEEGEVVPPEDEAAPAALPRKRHSHCLVASKAPECREFFGTNQAEGSKPSRPIGVIKW